MSSNGPHYLLVGHPVTQSLSPTIHNTALTELGLPGHYSARDVTPDHLPRVVAAFRREGVAGANVTVPHKQAVIAVLDRLSPAARAIGAVNTIVVGDDHLLGDNTDHAGFADPLPDRLPGGSVLILGAGGAARAVIFALVRRGDVTTVSVASRTEKRSEMLIDTFMTSAVSMEVCPWEDRNAAARQSHLIVNTTPVGMWPDVHPSPLEGGVFRQGQLVYDLIYNPRHTRLLREAASAGARTIDGLPMLIGQAAASFHLWTGRVMPRQAVERALALAVQQR